MKCLIILIIQITLELFVFPNLHDRVLSRTTIHFLSIMNSVYTNRNSLKQHSRFLPLLIIGLDYFFGKFVIIRFYDPECKYFDSLHSLVIIIISVIPFIFFTDNKDFEEFERNSFLKSLHFAFSNIIFVYKMFYFFKHFHLKQGNFADFNGKLEMCYYVVIDFLASNGSLIMNNIMCYYLSVDKKKRNFFGIFKKFTLMAILNILFYSIYSYGLAKAVFEWTNNNLPNKYNIILYNLLPKDLHIRFRTFVFIFNWFFI